MSKVTYKVAALTHVGKVRDHNEDNFILAPDLSTGDWYFDINSFYSPASEGAVWVVADGMGGTNAGEVASELAIQTVKMGFESLRKSEDNEYKPESFLTQLIRDANQNILNHAEQHPETEGMGSTLVIAWLLDENLHVSWIGDSRAYIFRSQELTLISRDHSLVQEMVDAGKLTEEQAFYHPNNNIITQSLGGDSKELEPGYIKVRLYEEDKILLCSDGLNGMLKDEEIEKILTDQSDTESVTNGLLQAALEKGGHDNITLVYTDITELDATSKTDAEIPPVKASDNQNMPNTTLKTKVRKRWFILMLFSFILGGAAVYYLPKVWNPIEDEGQEEEESPEEPIGEKPAIKDISKDSLTNTESDVQGNKKNISNGKKNNQTSTEDSAKEASLQLESRDKQITDKKSQQTTNDSSNPEKGGLNKLKMKDKKDSTKNQSLPIDTSKNQKSQKDSADSSGQPANKPDTLSGSG